MKCFVSRYSILVTWKAYMNSGIFILTNFCNFNIWTVRSYSVIHLSHIQLTTVLFFIFISIFLWLDIFIVFCSWMSVFIKWSWNVCLCVSWQSTCTIGKPHCDCTRKWSCKKENKMFHNGFVKYIFVTWKILSHSTPTHHTLSHAPPLYTYLSPHQPSLLPLP